jgi:hypothetical protein
VRPIADIIWCGVSAPVVQGVLVGLGISAVGLVVFPFNFVLVRPVGGKQSNFQRARIYIRWARGLAWALAISSGITLIGYVILYSDSSGRFCTARFDQNMQFAIFIWAGITGVTLGLLGAIAILRGLARRLSD